MLACLCSAGLLYSYKVLILCLGSDAAHRESSHINWLNSDNPTDMPEGSPIVDNLSLRLSSQVISNLHQVDSWSKPDHCGFNTCAIFFFFSDAVTRVLDRPKSLPSIKFRCVSSDYHLAEKLFSGFFDLSSWEASTHCWLLIRHLGSVFIILIIDSVMLVYPCSNIKFYTLNVCS